MRDRVLNDDRLHPLRVGQCHAEANRTAVVLHVKGVTRKSKDLGQAIDDGRKMIEGVRKLLGIRPIAVAEARVIGSPSTCNTSPVTLAASVR